MVVVNNAVVLVAPIPDLDRLVGKQLSECSLQLRTLRVEPREGLVMRKQDDLAGLRVHYHGTQPSHLLVVQCVISMSGVEPNQQPMGILHREIAGRLLESGKN